MPFYCVEIFKFLLHQSVTTIFSSEAPNHARICGMRLVNAYSTPQKRDVCINLYIHSRGCIILAVRVKKGTALKYSILTISTLSSKVFQCVVICLTPFKMAGTRKQKHRRKRYTSFRITCQTGCVYIYHQILTLLG